MNKAGTVHHSHHYFLGTKIHKNCQKILPHAICPRRNLAILLCSNYYMSRGPSTLRTYLRVPSLALFVVISEF